MIYDLRIPRDEVIVRRAGAREPPGERSKRNLRASPHGEARHMIAYGKAAIANDLCGRRKRRLEAPNPWVWHKKTNRTPPDGGVAQCRGDSSRRSFSEDGKA